MKYKNRCPWLVLTCCLVVFPLMGFASDNPEVYVVATDIYGNSSYAMSHGDGTLAQYEDLITFSDWRSYSYSNGVGDFDNDGDFDFVLARGRNAGDIIILEKIGASNQFVERNLGLSWSGAKYPASMAVADFNEDGNLDFIISYYYSTKCDLYTGDGNYGFTLSTLNATAPSLSFGADAADFNNDGHVDFVVAPYSGSFYINFGNGDGTFNTTTQANLGSANYYGVAAADFNRDGNVDLVATADSIIDIYYGTDTGAFDYGERILDSGIYNSPVDNYDFDGDGHQDIVLGAYSNPSLYSSSYTNGEGIAVMLGDGLGKFGTPVVFGGTSSGSYVTTISAPPVRNKEPVAAIYCDRSEVTVGQEFSVDGLDSKDEDGIITKYEWDFGDGTVANGSAASHVYNQAGEYTITLTVTDNRKDTGSAVMTMQVVPAPEVAVEAKMRIIPRLLHLRSHGRWMWGYVKLPKGYQAMKIEINSLVVDSGDSQQQIDLADSNDSVIVKTHRRLARIGIFSLRIKRQLIIDAMNGTPNNIVVGIQGQVLHQGDPVDFTANDNIRVIHPPKKKPRWWWWRWHDEDRGDDDDDDDDDDDEKRKRRCKYKNKYRHRHR